MTESSINRYEDIYNNQNEKSIIRGNYNQKNLNICNQRQIIRNIYNIQRQKIKDRDMYNLKNQRKTSISISRGWDIYHLYLQTEKSITRKIKNMSNRVRDIYSQRCQRQRHLLTDLIRDRDIYNKRHKNLLLETYKSSIIRDRSL